jgi:hypothetical protein
MNYPFIVGRTPTSKVNVLAARGRETQSVAWTVPAGRLGERMQICPRLIMCVRTATAPRCSGFTIDQIGGIMAMPHSPPRSLMDAMDLYFSKVVHPQAHDNYRVILKDDGLEVEIGSIGIQHGTATEAWVWAIDTVIPTREVDAQGVVQRLRSPRC